MGHFQRPTQRPTTPESSLEGGSLPVNRCSCGRESGRGCRAWGSGARGVGRWSAPRRRPLASVRRGTRASGEERPVRTSSRILLHLSRLIGAVAAVNRVAGARAWGSGATGCWWTSSKRAARRDMHGREAGACARGVVRPNLPCLPKNFRPLLPPPLHTKVWPARRAGPCVRPPPPHPAPASPPGRPPSPRTPRSSLGPSALSVLALTLLLPPVVQIVHWPTR